MKFRTRHARLLLVLILLTLGGCGSVISNELNQIGIPVGEHGDWRTGPNAEVSGKSTRDVFQDPQSRALAEAACHGDLSKLDALVKHGANVNATGYRDVSALAWTMICKNYEGAERLLELGANPNFKMKGTGDDSPMWLAAGSNDPHWLPMMLAHGGDPNIRSGYRTALMIAIEQDRMQNVKLLLEHGADVNEHYAGNDTAAMDAAALAKFDVVEMLLRHGYDYNLQDLTNMVSVDHVPPNDPKHAIWLQVLQILAAKGFHPNVVPHVGGPPPGLVPSSSDSGGGHP